jgi:HSP20 family molecular chaperone IbpA
MRQSWLKAVKFKEFFIMFFAPALRRSAYRPAAFAFDRLFDDALFNNVRRSADVAVTQDDKTIELTFDIPGIAREQLSIGIEGNVVRIETLPEAKRQYKAAYELAQDIDAAQSEAKLENGVLTLKLAKAQPADRSVKLAIQ